MGYYRLRRYRDSYARRRIIDSAVRHLKYNDGIKDIADKIKSKISEAINEFRSLPRGKKIAFLLASLATLIGTFFAAKNTTELVYMLKDINKVKGELEKEKENFEAYARGASFNPENSGTKDILDVKKIFAASKLVSVVISLTSAITAMISAKIAVAKKQVAEGADEARVVSEVMTR